MWNLDEIQNKAEYCLNCKTKPCTQGCPLGNDIPEFIKCIKNKEYKKAYEVLKKTTVLQPICGRICPHTKQCQGNCVRGMKGKPVSIGELEAFIGDMAIEENWSLEDSYPTNVDEGGKLYTGNQNNVDNNLASKKVAIVGSGPAGLTCATFLARKGVDVTIYEKHNKLGGLLRHGIPEFRLSKDLLDKQIKKILKLGIKVEYNKELGKDFTIDKLRKNYDAVFLAFGANVSRKMNIPGENLRGVYGGNELLENAEFPKLTGKKVAVIGGGNVAMDVSRTAKRLGVDKVTVIYRRAEEQMPAEKKEIEDAKCEGVEFMFQTNVVKINGAKAVSDETYESGENDDFADSNCVTSVECVKTELVKKEGDSRLSPVDIEGSNFVLDMDYVVMAVGAEAEKQVLEGLGLKLNKWGCIDVDEKYMTSQENVFAGGDLAGTKATVAWAARSGREAGASICEKLV